LNDDFSVGLRDLTNSKSVDPVKLTDRQLEIALLVADGLSGGDIAVRLKLTAKTVEYHRREIDKAIGVKGTALLVRWLIREGLLEP
jgi:two-component system, NarL family, invasion response regulator UvrY